MKKKLVYALTMIMAGALILSGCDDEDFEYSEDSEYSEEQEPSENQEDKDSGSDTEEEYSFSTPSEGLSIYDYPMGTVKEAEGTIAVVTILADDADSSWDFENGNGSDVLGRYHDVLGKGLGWLEKNIAQYDKEIKFVWDFNEHEELLYKAAFKTDLGATINDQPEGLFEADEIISNTVDSAAIMKSLNADGIVYFFAVNSKPDTRCRSCSFNVGSGPEESQKDYWYMMEGMEEPPYEYVFLILNYKNEFEEPCVVSHEWIHTLGVPDLYMPGIKGITQEFVDYAFSSGLPDIMLDQSAPNVKITDITAYYMGLTDYSETVAEWGFAPSEH